MPVIRAARVWVEYRWSRRCRTWYALGIAETRRAARAWAARLRADTYHGPDIEIRFRPVEEA
jgi:hypothetical protein